MIPAIKAEFRKLLTARSTYIVTALVVALVIFIAGYIEGWHLSGPELQNPGLLSDDVTGAMTLTIFGAIIAVLLMSHEYRYNTILYTLTSSNSRSKVLLAKMITVSAYAICLTLIVALLSPAVSYLGIHLHGHSLVSQTLHVWTLLWQSLFYGWAYGMAGLLLAVLIRSQVGTIAALFLIPGLVEQLLAQLLKHNAVYLPFTALSQVINPGESMGGGQMSPGKAAVVFGIYLVVGWIVAWVLFLRRDAS